MNRPCRIDGCRNTAIPRRTVCGPHKYRLNRQAHACIDLRAETEPDRIPPVVEDRLPDWGLTLADRRTAARELRERGVRAGEIARLLGVTERTVYRWHATARSVGATPAPAA